jgi:hypothetical protein
VWLVQGEALRDEGIRVLPHLWHKRQWGQLQSRH